MTDQTPRTEAGRAAFRLMSQSHAKLTRRQVAAIESEARAEALREAAERVRALNRTIVLAGTGFGQVHEPTRVAVLAILAGETE